MRWIAVALLSFAGACWGQGEEPPGEPVGVFEASGLMVEQSCGAAIPAPDPIDLNFQLRSEPGGRAYWQRPGGPLYAGVEKDGRYTFTVSQSWTVIQPDRFRGYVGCSVTQRDIFTFVVEDVEDVDDEDDEDGEGGQGGEGGGGGQGGEADEESGADAGVEPTLLTMSGSQATEIEPLAGADCTPAVASVGGPFLSLPCRVAYVLTGTGIGVEASE